jgi:hypothetical protein
VRSRDAVRDVERDGKSDVIGTIRDAGWYAIRTGCRDVMCDGKRDANRYVS